MLMLFLSQVKKSELASSLLVGEDGEQCVYVTTGEEGEEGEGTVLTLDASYADAVGQLTNVSIFLSWMSDLSNK